MIVIYNWIPKCLIEYSWDAWGLVLWCSCQLFSAKRKDKCIFGAMATIRPVQMPFFNSVISFLKKLKDFQTIYKASSLVNIMKLESMIVDSSIFGKRNKSMLTWIKDKQAKIAKDKMFLFFIRMWKMLSSQVGTSGSWPKTIKFISILFLKNLIKTQNSFRKK